MKLSEITQIDSSDWKGEKSDILNHMNLPFIRDAYKKAKAVPGGGGYTWGTSTMTGHRYDYNLMICMFDPDMKRAYKDSKDEIPVVGMLNLKKKGNMYTVGTSSVVEAYRGRRVGLGLYGLALDQLGLTLQSDGLQTPAGMRMWRVLASVPGVHVYALFYEHEVIDLIMPSRYGNSLWTPKAKAVFRNIKNKNEKEDNDTLKTKFFKEIGAGDFVDNDKFKAIEVKLEGDTFKSPYINVYNDSGATLVAKKL